MDGGTPRRASNVRKELTLSAVQASLMLMQSTLPAQINHCIGSDSKQYSHLPKEPISGMNLTSKFLVSDSECDRLPKKLNFNNRN